MSTKGRLRLLLRRGGSRWISLLKWTIEIWSTLRGKMKLKEKEGQETTS